MRQCQSGDQRAWAALVERYSALVYAIASRNRFSPSDADDIFQAVFLRLHRALARLREPERLAAWLVTTARRECQRLGGRAHRATDTVDLDSLVSDEDWVRAWEHRDLTREKLRELGSPCAELLAALFLDPSEPDYAEIADRLGMKPGSIGPTRGRCLRRLQGLLADAGIFGF